jgi:hypothetical protein
LYQQLLDTSCPIKIDVIIAKIEYKEALQILKYLPQKNWGVWQTLYSAISNATNNFDLEKKT